MLVVISCSQSYSNKQLHVTMIIAFLSSVLKSMIRSYIYKILTYFMNFAERVGLGH